MLALTFTLSTAWAQAPKRVTQSAVLAQALTKRPPDYPAVARQLRLEGSVEVDVFIDESGSVTKAEPLRGNPVLVKSAVDAVQKWKFKPLTEGDKPVKAVSTLSFTFKP